MITINSGSEVQAHLAAVGCNGQEISWVHLAAIGCNGLMYINLVGNWSCTVHSSVEDDAAHFKAFPAVYVPPQFFLTS